MKSRDLIFMLIVLAVIGGLFFLSNKNKAKALSPSQPQHLTAKTRGECFQCHQSEKLAELERQHKHPNKWRDEKVNCLLCHLAPQGSKAMQTKADQFDRLVRLGQRADFDAE